MPIMRITKQIVARATSARSAAIQENPDFEAFNRELERQKVEARRQREERSKA